MKKRIQKIINNLEMFEILRGVVNDFDFWFKSVESDVHINYNPPKDIDITIYNNEVDDDRHSLYVWIEGVPFNSLIMTKKYLNLKITEEERVVLIKKIKERLEVFKKKEKKKKEKKKKEKSLDDFDVLVDSLIDKAFN